MRDGHSNFDIIPRVEIIERMGAPGIHQFHFQHQVDGSSLHANFRISSLAKLAKLSLDKYTPE